MKVRLQELVVLSANELHVATIDVNSRLNASKWELAACLFAVKKTRDAPCRRDRHGGPGLGGDGGEVAGDRSQEWPKVAPSGSRGNARGSFRDEGRPMPCLWALGDASSSSA